MLRHVSVTAFTCLLLFGHSLGTAEEPLKEFKVCAGNCSRSMGVVSSHNDVMSAIRAVERLREADSYAHLGIGRGKNVEPLALHKSFTPTHKFEACQVYQRFCKACELKASVASVADAERIAKGIRASGGQAEIVYTFAIKKAQ